jgi:hypothetical protein
LPCRPKDAAHQDQTDQGADLGGEHARPAAEQVVDREDSSASPKAAFTAG